MYPVRIPFLTKFLYPKAITRIASSEKAIYLTFDDGPIPEVTPWVMEKLQEYNAKATFFCIGDNVQKHPEIYRQVLKAGHSVGNHTFNHIDGWKTSLNEYVENARQCSDLVHAKYFRPPYGHITRSQYKALADKYQIVLWHILSGDFDQKQGAEGCFKNIIKNARSGSVIVMHDSLKAWRNLEKVLPLVLAYYAGKGFQFKSITSS